MHPNYEKPFTLDRVVRIIIGAIIIVGLYLILRRISGALIPFFIAWLIAYLINPFVEFLQFRVKIKSRIASILLALVLLFSGLTGIGYLLGKPISDEIQHVGELIKNYSDANTETVITSEIIERSIQRIYDLPQVQDFISKQDFGQIAEQLIPSAWKIFSSSLNAVLSIFVVFIVLLYIIFILLDYDLISHGWIKLVPDKYRHFIETLAEDLKEGMNRYFRGQFTIASTVGVLFAIGFTIIDLPLGIIFGLFVGLLNLIPYLQIVSLLPAFLLVVLKSLETGQPIWAVSLSVFAVYVIVQTFQDGFLVPRIMGKRMGLNPAVILLSLSIWGALLGIIGMIIALPFTTLLVSYYRRFVLFEDVKEEPFDKKPEPPQ